jgi:hypothetical protein
VTGVTVGSSEVNPALEAGLQSNLGTDEPSFFETVFTGISIVGLDAEEDRIGKSTKVAANLDAMTSFTQNVNRSMGTLDSGTSPLHHGNFQPAGEVTSGSLDEGGSFGGVYGDFISSAVTTHWQHAGQFDMLQDNVTKINAAYIEADTKHHNAFTQIAAGFEATLGGKYEPKSFTGAQPKGANWSVPTTDNSGQPEPATSTAQGQSSAADSSFQSEGQPSSQPADQPSTSSQGGPAISTESML